MALSVFDVLEFDAQLYLTRRGDFFCFLVFGESEVMIIYIVRGGFNEDFDKIYGTFSSEGCAYHSKSHFRLGEFSRLWRKPRGWMRQRHVCCMYEVADSYKIKATKNK